MKALWKPFEHLGWQVDTSGSFALHVFPINHADPAICQGSLGRVQAFISRFCKLILVPYKMNSVVLKNHSNYSMQWNAVNTPHQRQV